ncbi:MAG: cell wall assembly protein [Phycisphaerales bacterium]|nr:cell wall assembly protein [Phycisphaerales bacterium]
MTLDEAIARLRELNETVPIPQRLPTEAEVSAAERELGHPFHPNFRKYLLEASDVVYDTKEPVTITDPDSHTHLQTVCEDAWEQMEVPKKLLPICEDNGDYYCMNKKGEIVFWSGDGATDEKWPSLAAWIEEVWIGEGEVAGEDNE